MKDQRELSPEQIENWRNVLVLTLGSYALIMPDAEVQRIHDTMQNEVDELTEKTNAE